MPTRQVARAQECHLKSSYLLGVQGGGGPPLWPAVHISFSMMSKAPPVVRAEWWARAGRTAGQQERSPASPLNKTAQAGSEATGRDAVHHVTDSEET